MVDALVSTCLAKLGALMEEEVVRTLAVRKDIKRLRKKLIYFSSVRENAEAQAMEDSGAETWYRDLKHLMFDIEDIIDLTMVNSRNQASSVDKALTSIPRGIGKFQHLYNLKGVFENGTAGFTLDELQNLSKIRHLWIEKLEKAMPRSTMVLSSMVHLKELGLSCTMDADPNNRTHYQTEQIERIQRVHEKLVPSRKLECIFFYGFPGVRLPGWLCSEPQDKLPHLGHMHFNECIAFSELPPAGQLPELQVLHVKGADAIRNTGAELPGKGVRMTLGSSTKVFPKLELIHISDMPNWETWSLSTVGLCSQDTTGDSHQVTLMPLKRVSLLHCPKLRALPEGLHRAANLREVRIEGAHSLHEIVNLPVVVLLKVKHNRGLRRIANLPKLEDLFVQDCPALDQAENLGKLKRLGIVGCAKAEQFRSNQAKMSANVVVLFLQICSSKIKDRMKTVKAGSKTHMTIEDLEADS
ncbi:putative NBS-LRR disease resistance protein [Panicum miliaceum]|uniref:NBS-LRR disease resistance protein n=1 Tax=Panicum miliaceum TaxID=4540 RepID=A0A3L6SKC9_PANMI|nr:putative NBS-LRR disease resistance protein [Panicum miliaceum]